MLRLLQEAAFGTGRGREAPKHFSELFPAILHRDTSHENCVQHLESQRSHIRRKWLTDIQIHLHQCTTLLAHNDLYGCWLAYIADEIKLRSRTSSRGCKKQTQPVRKWWRGHGRSKNLCRNGTLSSPWEKMTKLSLDTFYETELKVGSLQGPPGQWIPVDTVLWNGYHRARARWSCTPSSGDGRAGDLEYDFAEWLLAGRSPRSSKISWKSRGVEI